MQDVCPPTADSLEPPEWLEWFAGEWAKYGDSRVSQADDTLNVKNYLERIFARTGRTSSAREALESAATKLAMSPRHRALTLRTNFVGKRSSHDFGCSVWRDGLCIFVLLLRPTALLRLCGPSPDGWCIRRLICACLQTALLWYVFFVGDARRPCQRNIQATTPDHT